MNVVRTSPSEENYIEWIYRLAQHGAVRPGQLAEQLGVKRPSATRAVRSLAEKGLVEHERYGEIRLTASGQALGQAIVRRDQCLTRFLVDILDMPADSADPEVHRLEHVLSDDVLGRLEALVNFASSSEAWLKRLHHRIHGAVRDTGESDGFLAGQGVMHQGLAREKQPSEETPEDAG